MPDDLDQRTTQDDDAALEAALMKNARPGTCPPPDLLFAAGEDVLPAAEGEAIRAHAAQCVLCQTLLAGLEGDAAAALTPAQDSRIRARIDRGLERGSETPYGESRSPWRALLAIAAALVLMVGSWFGYRAMHRPAAASIAVRQPDANPPMEFAELHRISPLAAPEDAPGLVSRGDSSGASAEPSAADMLPAFRAYNRGDYSAAVAAFASLAGRFPDAEVPALYLGVSQLELGDNAKARDTLTRALSNAHGARHADATWYLAIAELRTGDAMAAAPLLQSLCSGGPAPYAPRACALAKQIR
ncbi:MAG TPA: tetratricopeptide repeat protein [Acidobacteriaceae bacterium]|nr:tetratricopeptide repeat protein [Acidobacteriaceae bacterium]